MQSHVDQLRKQLNTSVAQLEIDVNNMKASIEIQMQQIIENAHHAAGSAPPPQQKQRMSVLFTLQQQIHAMFEPAAPVAQ